MTSLEAEWDEDRGGTRNPQNLISFPINGIFHNMTKMVMPWGPAGAHANDRVVVPSAYVERLFRMAPVKDPHNLNQLKIMTRCLDVKNYMADALDLLYEEGLGTAQDDEGNDEEIVYATADDLQKAADKLVLELQDYAAIEVTEDSFEWLEDYNARPGTLDDKIGWFHALTLEDITKDSKNLEVYVDLMLVLRAGVAWVGFWRHTSWPHRPSSAFGHSR